MINCNENKPYIFISYAHKDSDRVLPIIRQAEKDGYNIWFDEGIDPGTEWDENIAKHVEECSYFVAFISNNYINSENCKDELNFSRDKDKKQFLVYLEDVTLPSGMAMRMNRIQALYWNKYAAKNINEAYAKLYSAEGINIAKINASVDIIENSSSTTISAAMPITKSSGNKKILLLLLTVAILIAIIVIFKISNSKTQSPKNEIPLDKIEVVTETTSSDIPSSIDDIAIEYLYALTNENYERIYELYPEFDLPDQNSKDYLKQVLSEKRTNSFLSPDYPVNSYTYQYKSDGSIYMQDSEFPKYKDYLIETYKKDGLDPDKITNAASVFYTRECYDSNGQLAGFDHYLLLEYLVEYDGRWYILDNNI